ncbi:MAG: hypothetical protein EP330_18885 [Deltaproteobacteria bacterium]|nr:MAG: hypothetical protein EP330_18885 [Deltaproteobacteria bacterium]
MHLLPHMSIADGRYVVEGILGEGGMAAVYRVRHAQLGTPLALKVLTSSSPDQRQRLMREGRARATLRHTNIVSVVDVLDVEAQPALLMEYVDGPSLDRLLRGAPLRLELPGRVIRSTLKIQRTPNKLMGSSEIQWHVQPDRTPRFSSFGTESSTQRPESSVGMVYLGSRWTRSPRSPGTPRPRCTTTSRTGPRWSLRSLTGPSSGCLWLWRRPFLPASHRSSDWSRFSFGFFRSR